MRVLHHGLWLLAAFVPVAFASCSGDGFGSAAPNGGDGSSDAGSSSHAGERSQAGTSNGDAGSGGTPNGSDGGTPNGSDGGTPNGSDGGTPNGSDGGTPNGSDGGTPNGGDGGDWSAAGAGHAGAPSAGAGGEAGEPPVLSPIVLFDGGPRNGLNFGGRVGLDQHCATAKQKLAIPGASTHALISVSASDELRDMPALYGLPTDRAFVGPTGKKVADNFADLLDGSIDQSLSAAGVSSADFWITGSNSDGSVRKTCDGWTTNVFSQAVMGSYGYPSSVNSNWLTVTGGDVYCSASQYHVICAAY